MPASWHGMSRWMVVRLRRLALVFLVTVAAGLVFGCSGEGGSDEETAESWDELSDGTRTKDLAGQLQDAVGALDDADTRLSAELAHIGMALTHEELRKYVHAFDATPGVEHARKRYIDSAISLNKQLQKIV